MLGQDLQKKDKNSTLPQCAVSVLNAVTRLDSRTFYRLEEMTFFDRGEMVFEDAFQPNTLWQNLILSSKNQVK